MIKKELVIGVGKKKVLLKSLEAACLMSYVRYSDPGVNAAIIEVAW